MARKVRTTLVAAALAVLMVAAAVPGQAQTEITFAWTGPNPGWERTIDNFNASQNEVKIAVEYIDWQEFTEKLTVRFSTGTAPDIFAGYPPLSWGEAGFLMDFQPLLERNAAELGYPDDWYTAVLDAYRINGHLYVWPVGVFPYGLLTYNENLLSSAGIGFPDDSWDWNTLADAARKLNRDTNGDGAFEQFGLERNGYTDLRHVWNHIASAGGRLFDDDLTRVELDEAAIRALDFMADITTSGVVPAEATGFANGAVAMTGAMAQVHVVGRMGAMIQNFQPGWAVFPKDPVTGGRSFQSGLGFVMASNHSKTPEAVHKFLMFVQSPEGYHKAAWEVQGVVQEGVPLRRSVAMSRYFLEPNPQIFPLDMNVLIDLTQYAAFEPNSNPKWPVVRGDVWGKLNSEWGKVIGGQQPVSFFVNQAKDLVNPILQGN